MSRFESLESKIKKIMLGEKRVAYQIGDQNLENDPDDQIVVGGYVTKHYDMSPPAQYLYSKLPKHTVVNSAEQSAKFQDQLFGLEKQVVLTQTATREQIKQAETYYDRAMRAANSAGLTREHAYLKKHLDFIKSKYQDANDITTTFDGPVGDDRFKTPPKAMTNPDKDRDIDNIKQYMISRNLKAQRKLKIIDSD